jgi:O-antigen ligase
MVLSLWFFSQSVHRVLSFNQWAFNLFAGLPKTAGPVLNLHTIAALLAVMIPPLFVMVFLKNRISLRIIILTLFLFFSVVLFLSDSGTGWLAIIVSMTFILVCWRKKLLWILIPTEGIITGAAVLFYDKLEWLRTTFSTSSFMDRVELWRNTITLLKGKAAITGLGSGSWLSVYNTHYSNTVAHVHNSYLQLYCDAGVLGFIAMILAAVIFIRFSINLLKLHQQHPLYWIGIGLIGTVISGAVFAIFDVTYSVTDVTKTGYIDLGLPLLWIGAALISVINNKLLER